MIEELHGLKETVTYRTISGFRLFDNTDYEGYPTHWHTPVEIIMPLRENYEVICENTAFPLREGDILFINSGVLHRMNAMHGQRLIFQADYSMLSNARDLEAALSDMPSALLITPEEYQDIYESLRKLISEIYEEYFSANLLSGASIYSKYIQFLVLLSREYNTHLSRFAISSVYSRQREYSDKLLGICNYINDHCTEDLSLEQVAEIAGFSKFYFSRIFKEFAGITFYKYLNKKRIEYAEKLLIKPDISITQVALQSGFSSISAFIRMFKIVKNCTPTEFRSLHDK